MSKKFNFKLQSVLRLKELKEDEIKGKLGQIVGKINTKLLAIEDYKNEVNMYFDRYEDAEKSKETMLGGLRAYMPEFLVSHYEKIRKCREEVEELTNTKNSLIEKLNQAKGQVKIFSNLKEKKYQDYKYKLNKKINDEIEELIILKGSKNEKI
jgi:flagellar export protein FliJ